MAGAFEVLALSAWHTLPTTLTCHASAGIGSDEELMMRRLLNNFVEWLRVKGGIRKTRARERSAEIEIRREMEGREAQDPIYKSPHDS
jgi:hypothetical protein